MHLDEKKLSQAVDTFPRNPGSNATDISGKIVTEAFL